MGIRKPRWCWKMACKTNPHLRRHQRRRRAAGRARGSRRRHGRGSRRHRGRAVLALAGPQREGLVPASQARVSSRRKSGWKGLLLDDSPFSKLFQKLFQENPSGCKVRDTLPFEKGLSHLVSLDQFPCAVEWQKLHVKSIGLLSGHLSRSQTLPHSRQQMVLCPLPTCFKCSKSSCVMQSSNHRFMHIIRSQQAQKMCMFFC